MLSIYDAASLDVALALPLDPRLRGLIEQRIASARAKGLADMTHIVAIQPGDTEADIFAEVGWSPLVNPIDGCRFGEQGFVEHWDRLQGLEGYGWEMIVTVGGSGFAFVMLIEDAPDTDLALAALCKTYASKAGKL